MKRSAFRPISSTITCPRICFSMIEPERREERTQNMPSRHTLLNLTQPGVLLPEMVTCLVLLQLRCPQVLHASQAHQTLAHLLDDLDCFNHLAPGTDKEDTEDLAWPGIWSMRCIFILLKVFNMLAELIFCHCANYS